MIPTVPPTPAGSDSGSHHEGSDDEAVVEKMELLVGDVKGKIAILIDDMIDTGHTVRLAAGVLRDAGAKEVYALISHGACFAFPFVFAFTLTFTYDNGVLSSSLHKFAAGSLETI